MKYKNIAISGDIGTGKTTLARNLAKQLGWNHLNTGEFIRKWYQDHEISLEETDKIPEEVDREIDGDFQKKMQAEEHTIFESRLAGWLARDYKTVCKVLCTSEYEEAVKRAAKRDGISVDEARLKCKARDTGLAKKFERLYGVTDYLDPKYFDVVVDTTTKTPEEVLQVVLQYLEANE